MRVASLVLVAMLSVSAQVPYERIVAAAGEPSNWLTYSGNYQAHRFSGLREITPANVAGLRPIWVYQLRERGGGFETSPIVVDGIVYITEPPSNVTALDARTGRRLWKYEKRMPKDIKTLGFGQVNRGVA